MSVRENLELYGLENVELLAEVLVTRPELFPDGIRVRWAQEQDLIFEATLGELWG